MIKKKLELDFLDEINKKFKISLDDPKEGLGESDISNAMDLIIQNNIFMSNNTNLLAKSSAKIIETTTETIDF